MSLAFFSRLAQLCWIELSIFAMDPHFILQFFILRELQRDGRRRAYRRRDDRPQPSMLVILVLLLGYRCYFALRWVYCSGRFLFFALAWSKAAFKYDRLLLLR